jgi:hypothetical protein
MKVRLTEEEKEILDSLEKGERVDAVCPEHIKER